MRRVSVISGHPISTGIRGLTGCQRDLRDRGVTPFVDFMLLPFCPYIGIYINLNSLNNKISLFHNMVLEHQA